MSIYLIVLSCSMMTYSFTPLGGFVPPKGGMIPASQTYEQTTPCSPGVHVTTKSATAKEYLNQGAQVYRIDERLHVYKLEKKATYFIQETEITP